jgi:spermidine synthase
MYTEKQPWGETKYDILPNSHIQFQTQKQNVDLISNSHFGRMLFLDGVLQLSSADEHIYHRHFAQHVMKQNQQSTILVAGGADGALLREIQDHDGKYNLGVKDIFLVDWDEELVTYLMNEEPYSRGSFDDPRLVTVFSDIQTYLEKDIPPFDSIFLDLLDPITFDDFEWTKQLLKKSVAKCIGSIGLNAGSDSILVENLVTFCEETFPAWKVNIKIVRVPSFQEPWFLLFMDLKGT